MRRDKARGDVRALVWGLEGSTAGLEARNRLPNGTGLAIRGARKVVVLWQLKPDRSSDVPSRPSTVQPDGQRTMAQRAFSVGPAEEIIRMAPAFQGVRTKGS